MGRQIELAVVGATGAVGEALLEGLAGAGLPIAKLHALAGEASAGKRVEFDGGYLTVRSLEGFDFTGVDLALFVVPDPVSEAHLPRALEAGCRVVDFSAAFSADPRARLVVAGVNGDRLAGDERLLVSPSPAAVALARVLAPIREEAGVAEVVVTVMEPASIRGRAGVQALAGEAARLLNAQPVTSSLFPQQLAFNLLAHPVPAETEEGWSRGELALAREVALLLGGAALPLHATIVQAPLFFGLALSVRVKVDRPPGMERLRERLGAAPGVELVEGEGRRAAPSPTVDAVGSDQVLVGRLRAESGGGGVDLWIACDNVRAGGAANGVQIVGQLLKEYL